ncbi:hypothetical protein J8L70_04795 [Pseudoalteromonas sp. MMG010]|uniref:hypothetical protein n=1 Tax=Pseudoalteromonas sp. MMG010 TaxID=2822685 RepID=UPI001B3A61AD|nr:hypothetical protein [Pseudoalteromonas sp. MMG010]MBQ4832552.1 hypothetical protein [Pseudoalteromonas sp. MMG010]
MPLLRLLSIIMLSFLLTACGSGDETLSRDSVDDSADAEYELTLSAYNNADVASNSVSADSPLEVWALLELDGAAVSGEFVTFTLDGDVGELDPSSGSSLTQSDGVAVIQLNAGSVEGAGIVTASYTIDDVTYTGNFAFQSSGDEEDDTDDSGYELTLEGYNSDGVESNSVTASSPIDLRATLALDGDTLAGRRITFTLDDDIGLLSPTSGTSLTQADGIASLQLTAGTVEGAGVVTASYTLNDVTYSDTFEFQSSGDEEDDISVSGTTLLEVSILDAAGNKFTSDNPVTSDNQGIVTATLTSDGVPLSDQLISFSTNFTGEITPVLGTASTNDSGEASVTLNSGDLKGAGQVVASYTSSTDTISSTMVFYSSGDGASDDESEFTVTVLLLTGCNADWDDNRSAVRLDPTDASTGCSVVHNISSTDLGEIYVEVVDQQSGDGSAYSLVNVETNLGSILPSSGAALTDAQGVALLKLQPGDTGGAGTINATAQNESDSINFAVGTADLTLEVDNGLEQDDAGNDIPLNAGGSTVIVVTLLDEEGELFTTATDVEFSSTCYINEQAEIDDSVKSSGGIASATYQAKGCSGDDTVTISVETGGENFTASTVISIEESPIQSIQFVQVSESFIALPPGEGGLPTQSEVEFQLFDQDGLPATQQRIDFKLTDSIGAASLTQLSADTDDDGFVSTSVTSGVVPGPIVVKACYVSTDDLASLDEGDDLTCWTDDYDLCMEEPDNEICPDGTLHLIPLSEQISSVSSQITLNSGVTDQNSFDASPVTFNTNSLNYNGVTTDITVYFGDQFNHFNADGVEATVIAEAGVIGSESDDTFCQTSDATCTVTWRSQGDIPFYDYKWGNRIGEIDGDASTTEGINPKTETVNCDPYFSAAAPCIGGITRAKNDADGVVMGGRVSVLAITKGQENFVDEESSDGVKRTNGLFDIGEYYASYDLSEAFNDHNENLTFDKANCSEAIGDAYSAEDDLCSPLNSRGGHNETWRDLDNNGIFDEADGMYNGLLCSEAAQEAEQCTRELIEVRKQLELVMSGDDPYVRFAVVKTSTILDAPYEVYVPADCSSSIVATLETSDTEDFCDVGSIDLSNIVVANPDYDATDPDETDPETVEIGLASISIYIFYSDEFGNPLPAGTSVSISSTNGDFDLLTHEATVPNTNSDQTSYSVVSISRESDGNDLTSGVLSITFEFDNVLGESKTITQGIAIIDDK